MVILAVDYGDARTGIAICDKNEILASALCTIRESYTPKLIEKICEIIKEKEPKKIVVGKPVNMDGSEGERALKCTEFAHALEQASGLPCEMYDERMTTVIAHHSLNFTNTRGKKRKAVVDALSAQIILQDYLETRKN